MPTPTFVQTSFTSGEVSPRFLGRTDLQRYGNGVLTMENAIVQKLGGFIRRPGTRFINAQKDSFNRARLIPFEFSTEQTYVLEIGDGYIRFFRNDSQGNPGILIDPNTTEPTELVSPWSASQLPELTFVQSADILYLLHPDHQVRQLRREPGDDADAATWELTEWLFRDGPYQDEILIANQTYTMTINEVPGDSTRATLISTQEIADWKVGLADQSKIANTTIRIRTEAAFNGWFRVESVDSATQLTLIIGQTTTQISGSINVFAWQKGAWNGVNPDDAGNPSYETPEGVKPTVAGWPITSSFHGNRFYFGGSYGFPQRLWGSAVGEFDYFGPFRFDEQPFETLPDDAVTFNIDDNQVNAIQWLDSDAQGLAVMTTGGTYIGTGGQLRDAITPDNILVRKQTNRGANEIAAPQKVGETILIPDASGNRVREFVFDFDIDRFTSPDLTLLSEHILIEGDGLLDTSFAEEPDSIFWGVRNDGQMVGFTFEKGEQIFAWHRHILGGSFNGGAAVAESVAVIRNGSDDQIWVTVKRTIDGSTVRYVEVFEPLFPLDGVLSQAFFVDSGLSYAGPPTSTVTGLGHIEGERVAILVDGGVHPDRVVQNGAVVLEEEGSFIVVGLPYVTTMTSLPIIPPPPGYDPRGKRVRGYKAFIRLHNTMGGEVGSDPEDTSPLVYREAPQLMGEPPPLFTGISEFQVAAASDRQTSLTIKQEVPQPLTVLSVTNELVLDGV